MSSRRCGDVAGLTRRRTVDNMHFMPFPLPFVPKYDYHPGKGHARWFGANRPKGRKHAGCDLIAPVGTEIFAIDDGVVYDLNPRFYLETGMIAVRHRNGFVVRYCEVVPTSIEKWQRGMAVRGGDVLAKVGKLLRSSMLHFELYSGKVNGPLTNRKNSPFQRRSDLLDPTALLDALKRQVNVSAGPVTNPDSTAQTIG
jgi:murein DD-endopeptidase MepM/ murein hydrolase activator NlpD